MDGKPRRPLAAAPFLGSPNPLLAPDHPPVRLQIALPNATRIVFGLPPILPWKTNRLTRERHSWTKVPILLRTSIHNPKGRVRLGILLSPGAEVAALDCSILAVPLPTFFGLV